MKRPEGTKRFVDPGLLSLLDPDPTVDLTPEILAIARTMAPRLPHFPDASDRVTCEVISLPRPNGLPPLEMRLYRPIGTDGLLPCIYHTHGGGYVAGSAAESEPVYSNLAADLGCLVASVEYRLAPETPFPGGHEDCYDGLRWVFANADRIRARRNSIGVMGESAGGGLAASLALMARDRGEFELAFQHLIYPMIDDRTCIRSDLNPNVGEFIWTPHNNAFGWTALLGGPPGVGNVSPYAAPARAGSLDGLPPTFISIGALDLFLEENMDYARRLMAAGVPVELHVYPGGIHGFDLFADAPLSRVARKHSKDALAKVLGHE